MSNPAPGRTTPKKTEEKADPKNSFVLAEKVGILNYNFEPYGEEGVVPEPSSVQIAAFKRAIAELIETTAPAADAPPPEPGITASNVKRMADMLSRDSSEEEQKLLHAIAEVCSDQPSFDTLDALPYRAQQSFFGWISGTFLLPEA